VIIGAIVLVGGLLLFAPAHQQDTTARTTAAPVTTNVPTPTPAPEPPAVRRIRP